MKLGKVVLGSLMLASAPLAAMADDMSYSYVDAAYVETDIDGAPSADGFGLRGSVGFAENWFVFANYSSQSVQGIAILGVLTADTPLAIGAWLCVAGVCTGSLSLNIYAVAQMFAGPKAAGSWIGFQNAFGNSFSGILGPILAGVIVARAGYDGAFYVAAAVAILGGIWWIFAIPRIEQVELQ